MRARSASFVVAGAAAVLLSVAACSGGGGTAEPTATVTSTQTSTVTATPSGPVTPTPNSGDGSGGGASGSGGGSAAAGGACDAGALTGSMAEGGGGAAGSVEFELVLTNTASSECTLQGWPGVSFVGDGNGTQLGAPAEQDFSSPHPTVTLAAKGTAIVPIKVTQAANYPAADCQPTQADGFRVYPPGSKASLFIADPLTACAKADVSIMTVQAVQAG